MRTQTTLTLLLLSCMAMAQDYTDYDAIPESDRTVIFEDNFSDNENEWQGQITERMRINVGGGAFSAKSDNYYRVNIRPQQQIELNKGGGFEVEANLKYSTGKRGYVGLTVGRKDDSKYTTLRLDGDQWRYEVYYGFDKEPVVSSWAKESFISKNGYNKATIRKVHGQLYFFINEQFAGRVAYGGLEPDDVSYCIFYNGSIDSDWIKASRLKTGDAPEVEETKIVGNTIQPLTGSYEKSSKVDEGPSFTPPTSDVDVDVPATGANSPNTYALIIGNENYESEITVDFARNDAYSFKTYLQKTAGIPEENIHLVMDATYGLMLSELQWLENIAHALRGEAKIIFYYAGHGMPDEKTQSAYLLPVDGSASMANIAIPLSDVYARLAKHTTQSNTVFLDACFSGAARSGMLASGRGVAIKPKEEPLKNNLVVFSATTGEQTAHPYKAKTHGLFTYFLLKKLKETKGEVNYYELSEYLDKEVAKHSMLVNEKVQIPQVNTSAALQDSWKSLKFK